MMAGPWYRLSLFVSCGENRGTTPVEEDVGFSGKLPGQALVLSSDSWAAMKARMSSAMSRSFSHCSL